MDIELREHKEHSGHLGKSNINILSKFVTILEIGCILHHTCFASRE